MNNKELRNEYGFSFFVIYDGFNGRAYDVPAVDDKWVNDDDIVVVGGFYSGDVAFATALAINNGVIKISEL